MGDYGRRIILVGQTGNGKITTGNLILSQTKPFKVNRSPKSVTLECTAEKEYKEDMSRLYTVVDTPGLFDAKLTFVECAKEIHRSLEICPNPHAFFVVFSTRNRLSPEEINTIDALKIIFGDTFCQHAIIIFTTGNDFNDNKFEEFLKADKKLTQLIEECQHRVIRVDSKHKRHNEDILNKIEEVSRGGQSVYEENGKDSRLRVFHRATEKHKGRFDLSIQQQLTDISDMFKERIRQELKEKEREDLKDKEKQNRLKNHTHPISNTGRLAIQQELTLKEAGTLNGTKRKVDNIEPDFPQPKKKKEDTIFPTTSTEDGETRILGYVEPKDTISPTTSTEDEKTRILRNVEPKGTLNGTKRKVDNIEPDFPQPKKKKEDTIFPTTSTEDGETRILGYVEPKDTISPTTSTEDEKTRILRNVEPKDTITAPTFTESGKASLFGFKAPKDKQKAVPVSETASPDLNRLESQDISNSKELRSMCIQLGRTSQKVVDVCKRISMKILVCSRSFKYVLPTYKAKPADPNEIVFVVFCEPGTDTDIELPHSDLSDFDIKKTYCIIGEYNNEEKAVINKQGQLFSKTETTDQKNLTDILHKTTREYMQNHSNLNIITASPVKSKGFLLNNHEIQHKTPCVVFYVCLKGYIPIQEEEFPRNLGSYKTDVREGAFVLYNEHEKHMQKLKMGCSIGEHSKKPLFGGMGGTLGAFIDLENGDVGCITSAHILLNPVKLSECKNSGKQDFLASNTSSTICQPAPSQVPFPDTKPFGRVTSVVYKTGEDGDTGVEAGLVTITDPDRCPDDGRFPKVPKEYTEENQLNYMSGDVLQDLPDDISHCTFYKYGATTGLTRGAFKLQATAVRTTGNLDLIRDDGRDPKCELHNQIEVVSLVGEPVFAELGDSGSLVLLSQNNDLHAIGLLTGGAYDYTKFYVTPIWEVLKALILPMQLKQFSKPNEQVETDDNLCLTTDIDTIKVDIAEMKTHIMNEVASVESKVEQINTELTEKVDKLGTEMSTKVDMDKLDNKVDTLGSDIKTMKIQFTNLTELIKKSKNNL